MTYEEAVHYIEEIPKFTSKTSLEHTEALLEKLGNPLDDLKVIHVAGTNGKGSTCAYLDSMLRQGGYKTGLFTSPHLMKINERFMISGVPVDDGTFLAAFEKVMAAKDFTMAGGDTHPTYFETLLLMGAVIFKEEQVDYLILETGLGGRLDATNVVKDPLACIITSISRDHTEYLGETITDIAGEKAGIIKPGVPVIYDGRQPEAARVIKAKAEEMNSPYFALTEDMVEWKETTRAGIRFAFRYPGEEPTELQVPYVAQYQMMNAALAWFTMKNLKEDHKISEEKRIEGIRNMNWPGRMETVMDGVIIDGAHNEDGVAQFIQTAVHFRKENEITILFSAVADKRYKDMIKEIAEGIAPDHVIVTQIWGSREVSAEVMAEIFREKGCKHVETETNVGKAFELAYAQKGDGMMFCVGSLYLAGEVKEYIAHRTQEDMPC